MQPVFYENEMMFNNYLLILPAIILGIPCIQGHETGAPNKEKKDGNNVDTNISYRGVSILPKGPWQNSFK